MGLWGLHRRILCLWLLLLGFTLLLLIVADLFHGGERHSQQKLVGAPRRPFQQSLRPPDDLELLGDAALELVPDFVPINSLKEDQLLFVASTQGTKDPPHKKGNYKVLLPAARKEFLSARVGQGAPPDRSLPETRHPKCLGEQYSESLPSASVVICFHDEAWSTLLRTLHSVLNTTPRSFLLELLLVDDLSTHDDLKTMLSEYVSQLDGVHLIRSTKRLGAGGCRNLGASKASGEVLVFMDSHCECHSGWLEPLLERVAQDRTRVVSPILDVIHRDTFKYNATRWPVWGVFDWNLDFSWESKPQLLDGDSDLAIEPVLSPALGGGVLAVDRHFFHNVGAFDPGILLWGGEQIELSIRVWLCGGSMEVVPCSRVAHLDYHQLRRLQDQEQLERNKIRIADTWMDTYRNIFYRRDTLAHFIRQSERPNITERQQLKMTLGCRDFHWYLTTIHPQLYIPQDRPGLSGELYNVAVGGCVDHSPGQGPHGGAMILAPCSGTGSQHCDLNSDGEVRWGPAGALCLGALGERVVLSQCQPPISERLQWTFIKLSGQLLHRQSQLCVEAVKDGRPPRSIPSDEVGAHTGEGDLVLRPCTRHPTQQWYFEQLVSP
ncbi:polypeptide N-acetylgalactosaminyltransferase 15-like isoform X2 [Hippocampus comes]|uniref:polypeptide N-acetylgalactosaminyltransferase 15-like isoform X1 n=1 Tax=Hippocampus comes TaxID=109280 RepID=UPI00094E551F|nr:PREDICTED: polypeptide N-acetylgalactosaminyltransferase 15-like isoform X1 [Hippocampus comes]XP_019724454.1 PREDICTED: polypeptide N-acetylgalactosaminyltransferase 15-like isoform X2 [Hippocampus comes]